MNTVLSEEFKFKQFEDTFDALLEMKEVCQSEEEDDRIDAEITAFLLNFK